MPLSSVLVTRLVVSFGAAVGASLVHFFVTRTATATLRKPVTPFYTATENEIASNDVTTGGSSRDVSSYTEAAQKDLITNLPGLDYDPGFNQFSGYLTVSEENNRKIFYWYVESQGDPANDPVLYWTNGGPGCSGLLGFGTEHGPFFVSKNGRLRPRESSWTKIASILYVEQPAGVGFSYSENPDDSTTGDQKAAVDNFVLIQQFFERFPERKTNDFYLGSESYGGHYIPQLTKQIIDRNTDGAINFRGFLVGNPWVDQFTNRMTKFQAFYQHGLLAKPLYEQWKIPCSYRDTFRTKQCRKYEKIMFREVGDGINPYALDYPVCIADEEGLDDDIDDSIMDEEELPFVSSKSGLLLSPSSQSIRLLHLSDRLEIMENDAPSGGNPPLRKDKYQPCGEMYIERYLNRDDVRQAIHVEVDKHWDGCSDALVYSSSDKYTSQIGLYRELVSMAVANDIKLNMMVFSGDDDSVCSTAGTQEWIFDLGVKPQVGKLWNSWIVNKQVAGFITHFDLGSNAESTFTFATVHGAGHEVPSYRPEEALHLFKAYFSGEW